ncbi:MAG TPA: RNA-binding protein [Methylomirabilota bacterium]|nr:RNA-binding protein [Methylomirabilota bacterium]
MSQKLYVGGIAFTTTSEGLRSHFAQSGTVVSASIVTDQFSGQSRGFGFVEMSTAEEAQQAVSQLNERPLDGRSLKVEVAKPKTDKPRGGGGGFGGRSSGGGNWR